MSDKQKHGEDDDSAILLEDADGDSHQKQNLQINAADEEMLLLSSSPSPPSFPPAVTEKRRVPTFVDAGPSGVVKALPMGVNLNTNTSNITIDDSSESEGESSKNSNSVEVIGSDYEDEDDIEEVSDSDESIGAYLDGKVQIFMAQGSFFIWNADDVHMLREECRIVGKLVGCLPRAPCQNNQLGLPLQLMPEEAKLLEEIEAGFVVEEIESVPEDIAALRKSLFQATREENYKVQKELYKESRKAEVLQHKEVIIKGKKAKKRKIEQLENIERQSSKSQKGDSSKLKETKVQTDADAKAESCDPKPVDELGSDSDDKELGSSLEKTASGEHDESTARHDESTARQNDEVINNDVPQTANNSEDKGDVEDGKNDSDEDNEDEDFNVDKMVGGETHVKHSLIQLFTENPWKDDVRRPKQWIFPLSQKEFLRYEVFRDLWKKGYFLTSGSKFGGDFLVYPGDPARFHSHFIAVCIDKTVDLSALDIISLGRLGSNVRKTVLLCAFDESRRIAYTSLQWTGIR